MAEKPYVSNFGEIDGLDSFLDPRPGNVVFQPPRAGIEEALARVVSIDPKEEFMLSHFNGDWCAEWSNPSMHVRLGESEGVYSGFGASPLEAIEALLRNIQNDEKA